MREENLPSSLGSSAGSSGEVSDASADRVLLSQLWTKAYPMVFAFVRATVRDFHSCEDIMQEVATAAAKNFDQYERDRPFSAWAIGVARNKVLMHLRKSSGDRHVFDDETIQAVAVACVEVEPELSPRRIALEQCASKVQGRARKVLEMRYARGEQPAAIAKVTGMTANAVSILLHRTRRALRDCIERQVASVERSRNQPSINGGHS